MLKDLFSIPTYSGQCGKTEEETINEAPIVVGSEQDSSE